MRRGHAEPMAGEARQLPGLLKMIAAELRHQYLLGYSPARTPVPGSNEWRAISVLPGAADARAWEPAPGVVYAWERARVA